jgi:large subunit ribosomal protein L15
MKFLNSAEFHRATGEVKYMLRLHNLQPRPGARHRVKRLGCGESSGHGKTSGKGHKGQKARSGGSIRLGFEGGQMPLIRRLPKRGFNNAAFHKGYAIVNVGDLSSFEGGTVVNEQLLRESNLVRGHFAGIKILGEGELKHELQVQTDKISATAREKIEKAGGTVTLRERRTNDQNKRDATTSEVKPDAAAATPRQRTKTKTKSRKKKSE